MKLGRLGDRKGCRVGNSVKEGAIVDTSALD